MLGIPDHPGVTATQRNGYPSWVESENRDNAESRRTFAEEHIKDFVDWVLESAPGAIDEFVEDHKYKFNRWLN